MQRMCMCISVMCKFTARGHFCVTQTLLTNLVGQLSLQGFFNPPSLPLNLIVTMLHVLCTIIYLLNVQTIQLL